MAELAEAPPRALRLVHFTLEACRSERGAPYATVPVDECVDFSDPFLREHLLRVALGDLRAAARAAHPDDPSRWPGDDPTAWRWVDVDEVRPYPGLEALGMRDGRAYASVLSRVRLEPAE